MGWYIETNSPHNKAKWLIENHGAQQILNEIKSFSSIPENKALICVLDNRLFEAALVVMNQYDYEAAKSTHDPRPRIFLLMDKEIAFELCGHKEIKQ